MQPANILKIETLNESWRDKDSVMLHACFQLLKDCIEKEHLLSGHVDLDVDDRHRSAKAEIIKLYDWWLSYIEQDIPDQDSYQIETQMLLRLIKVRWVLWT